MISPEQEKHSDKCAVRVNCGLTHDMKKAGCDCDGFHTFNELYKHRHALFVALCNHKRSLGWKSFQHEDGSMFEGMFIAGFSTPDGPVTYHLPKRYWALFHVQSIERAPKWDGHTSDDVAKRLLSIQ